LWSGQYNGVDGQWLRWYDWIPTNQEKATQEFQGAERLAAKLQELGINPG
jgi:hypothetical protein